MRGATYPLDSLGNEGGISIHTPHAGRDKENTMGMKSMYISIHTPHAGRD